MESRCNIQLTVMYAKDLKAFNFFQKLNVYALVSTVSQDGNKKVEQKQKQRTPADKEGDGNPEWKYKMSFDLSEASFRDHDHLFIQFDLRHEGLLFGDKTIGEVRVPFKDLIQESNGVVRFVNYEVRTPKGEPNGILNFSFKVNVNGTNIGTNPAASEITGYPLLPDIQYPSTLTPNSGTQEIHYPSLEWQDTHQDTFSAPQQVQYLPHENYYYPPPPPPPAFPHPLVPPPPQPMAHGACYHPPCPPQVYHWAPNPSGYAMYGKQDPLQEIRSFAKKIYDELGAPVAKLFVSGPSATAFTKAFGYRK